MLDGGESYKAWRFSATQLQRAIQNRIIRVKEKNSSYQGINRRVGEISSV